MAAQGMNDARERERLAHELRQILSALEQGQAWVVEWTETTDTTAPVPELLMSIRLQIPALLFPVTPKE